MAVIMEWIARVVKYRVRRLTPLECERLDGFPDYWTRYGASGKEMSDNARYMALGNSIAVPCAERVFIGIKKADRKGFAVINHVRKLYVGRWLHILERWKRTWGKY